MDRGEFSVRALQPGEVLNLEAVCVLVEVSGDELSGVGLTLEELIQLETAHYSLL